MGNSESWTLMSDDIERESLRTRCEQLELENANLKSINEKLESDVAHILLLENTLRIDLCKEKLESKAELFFMSLFTLIYIYN